MQFALRDLVRGRCRATHCRHRRGGCFLLSSCERVAAEEAVQLPHFAGGIVRFVERLEPRQLGLDEARERFDRRRDGEFFAGLLARDEFGEQRQSIRQRECYLSDYIQ